MKKNKSLSELMMFLDYLADSDLMKRSTVRSRKITVNKVFKALNPKDRKDVLSVDVDEIMERFTKLEGENYTARSLRIYKSRVISALEDFSSYLIDPMGFKPSTQKRLSQKSEGESRAQKILQKMDEINREPQKALMRQELASTILPIPIRADLVVKIQGIPFDLTENEAAKISAVVTAMANTD